MPFEKIGIISLNWFKQPSLCMQYLIHILFESLTKLPKQQCIWSSLHINWFSQWVYLALVWNAYFLFFFNGTHMVVFYTAQLNLFKLGLTFWSSNPLYKFSLLIGIKRAAAANVAWTDTHRVLTDWGVRIFAVTTVFSERSLPAFNGLTYIPVQRANKASLV